MKYRSDTSKVERSVDRLGANLRPPRPIAELIKALMLSGNRWMSSSDLCASVIGANGKKATAAQVRALARQIPGTFMIHDEIVRLRTLRPSIPDGIDSRCRACGDMFRVAPEELEWLARRDLSVPRRCRACRRRTTIAPVRRSTVPVSAPARARRIGPTTTRATPARPLPLAADSGEACLHGLDRKNCASCAGPGRFAPPIKVRRSARRPQ